LGLTLAGFLSVLLLLYLPVIRGTLGYAYIDNGLASFSWGATLALALWASADGRSRRALIIAGMLARGAAGTKILGGVLALLLGLYLLLVRRDWGASLTYAIATIAFDSWWYVRSTILSGDPIHPWVEIYSVIFCGMPQIWVINSRSEQAMESKRTCFTYGLLSTAERQYGG
jgi:hypothetical protein